MSRALGTKPSWIDKFIRAFLQAADANVIAVDWVYGSTGVYFSAVDNVVKLSLEISRFLSRLLVGMGRIRFVIAICTGKSSPKGKDPLLRFRAEAETPRELVGG